MLTFFRKHQKAFFAVVAVFTIASFLFFGSYGVINNDVKMDDYPVGTTIDEKKVSYRKLHLLKRFLATSAHERHLIDQRAVPNLLNDGVLQKDFLETGFASLLAQRYFDFFKEEWDKKIERIKTYHPYQHPFAPFLSAPSLWTYFCPSLGDHFAAIKDTIQEKKQMDLQGFSLLCSLYLDQTQFPPDVLRQVLTFHENQYSSLPKDPALAREDLSLFGFHTLEDWLGKRFLIAVSETILNGAALAKQQGFSIGAAEARASLMQNLQENYAKLFNKEMTSLEREEWYHRLTASIYCEEEELLEVWSDVLLFRKYFHELASSIEVDSKTMEPTANFAAEAMKVDLFHFPEELKLKTFRDVLKLQTYIEATAPSKKQNTSSLSLPSSLASAQEAEKRCPELVQTDYEVELKQVDLHALSEEISLREAYQWVQDPSHWKEITKAFPELKEPKALESLNAQDRVIVDLFAKKQIAQAKPDWLEKAFSQAGKKQVALGFRFAGGNLPLKGDVDREELKKRLDACKVGETFSLSCGEYFYQITLLSSNRSAAVLPFSIVNADGTLDLLLDRTLHQVYPEIRKKHPAFFSNKEGGFKPLKEVEDRVGAELYAGLLQKMDEEAKRLGFPDQKDGSLDVYAKYRLLAPLQEAKNMLMKGQAQEGPKQWHLVKEEKVLTRHQAAQENMQRLFEEKENSWSSVHMKNSGKPYFYHILGRQHKEQAAAALTGKAKELLELDAERMLFADLLDKMASRDLIAYSQTQDE